jgi:hypothetical protein
MRGGVGPARTAWRREQSKPRCEKESARALRGQNGPVAGRPSKLTEERADDLVVLLAARVPVEVAARSVNVSRRTLDRWLRQEGFRERIERARARDTGEHGGVIGGAAGRAAPPRRRARRRASAWYLERRFPERWAERA